MCVCCWSSAVCGRLCLWRWGPISHLTLVFLETSSIKHLWASQLHYTGCDARTTSWTVRTPLTTVCIISWLVWFLSCFVCRRERVWAEQHTVSERQVCECAGDVPVLLYLWLSDHTWQKTLHRSDFRWPQTSQCYLFIYSASHSHVWMDRLKLQSVTSVVNKQNCVYVVEEYCSRIYFSLLMSMANHAGTGLLRSGV